MNLHPPLARRGPFKIIGYPIDPTIDVATGVYYRVIDPDFLLTVTMPNGWKVTQQYRRAPWIYYSCNISTDSICH